MKPTDVLREEHKAILRMIDATDAMAAKGGTGAETMRSVVDFVRNFADECHHAKEERVLFDEAGKAGFPTESGPIPVMLEEHELGRACARRMADAAERGDDAAFTAAARDYAAVLRPHIDKEDNVLYPMLDAQFSSEVQSRIAERFEEAERALGEDVHERYLSLLRRVEREAGTA